MVTSSEQNALHRGPVTAEQHLFLSLPADPGAASASRSRVGAWLTENGWPPLPQEDLVLALSEAVSNAVEHGYGVLDDPAVRLGVVEVAAEVLADGRIEIVVRDRGGWRTPSQLPSDRRHGIPIMKACVADCVIDGTPLGTTVSLRSHPLPG